MTVEFQFQTSGEATNKFREVEGDLHLVADKLKEKQYGEYLKFLHIQLHCMHAKFDASFPPQRPKFFSRNSNVMHRGERIEKLAGTLEYQVRLNFDNYTAIADIQSVLKNDILQSLDILNAFKNLKIPDLTKLKSDFHLAFDSIGW